MPRSNRIVNLEGAELSIANSILFTSLEALKIIPVI